MFLTFFDVFLPLLNLTPDLSKVWYYIHDNRTLFRLFHAILNSQNFSLFFFSDLPCYLYLYFIFNMCFKMLKESSKFQIVNVTQMWFKEKCSQKFCKKKVLKILWINNGIKSKQKSINADIKTHPTKVCLTLVIKHFWKIILDT